MKKFLQEFKTFALRGNVIDLAVGVLIGGAFQGLVTSLTDNLINPLIGMLGGANFDQYMFVVGDAQFKYGAFVTAVINFIIMALLIFLLVKGMNRLAGAGKKEEAPAAPTTKTCPYCLSEIPLGATKCAHCASTLDKD